MSLILIVDDNRELAHSLEIHLTRNGYKIARAYDGEEAIERLASPPLPDLLLLDIMMPKMDGYEVLRIIRSNDRLHDLPILLLSALGQTEQIVEGLTLGANDYLAKPFNFSELLARVKTQLRIRQLERDLLDAERVKVLSEMTGAAVHELSQPITALLARLELCLKRLPKKSPIRSDLDLILADVNRLVEILQKIQEIKSYQTKEYTGVGTVIDIHKASQIDDRGSQGDAV